ncbi:MAG: T9SS type A sorting domain-containing protein [Flavobacteriales bacterium]|nr:T9SS type A sorting domain-containing protein [Flavobacteriales bacterium]
MKRLFTTLGLTLCYALLFAQNLDSLNLNKYWTYKDHFLKHFIHVGKDEGESLPMDLIRWRSCGDMKGYKIEAGDVVASLGMYLAALATEYNWLKETDDYEKLQACQSEIYFALKAFDRLDVFAEKFISNDDPSVPDTKGFFVRDDVPENFYKFWEVTDSVLFHGAHATNGFIPDSILVVPPGNSIPLPWTTEYPWLSSGSHPLKATLEELYQDPPFNGFKAYKSWEPVGDECGDMWNLSKSKSSSKLRESNEMSQDHALGMLMGLRFLQIFINDENLYIQPATEDSGMWLMAETRILAERIMNHMSKEFPENTEMYFEVKGDDSSLFAIDSIYVKFRKARYILTNPVTGRPVDRGWEAFMLSGGYEILGEQLTGIDYPAGCLDMKNWNIEWENTFVNEFMTFIYPSLETQLVKFIIKKVATQSINSVTKEESTWRNAWGCYQKIYDDCLSQVVLQKMVEKQGSKSDVMLNMVMRLAAITASWNHEDFTVLATMANFPWFELMDACVKDITPTYSQDYYRHLLDSADCTGIQKWPSISYPDTIIDKYLFQIIDTTDTPWDTTQLWLSPQSTAGYMFLNFNVYGGYYSKKIVSVIDTQYKTLKVYPHEPFNRSDIFSTPNRSFETSNAWREAEYNPISYMLLHNMYRISFKNSLQGKVFTSGCPCQSSLAQGFSNNVNTGLKDTLYTIARFPEYNDIGIRVPEFLTHDVNIYNPPSIPKGGQLKPKGDLTICNAKLALYQASSIRLSPSNPSRKKELRIARNAILELNNNSSLILDSNNRVIVESGGLLRIWQGSHIILDKGSTLEINGNLELMYGVLFSIEPGPNGIGRVIFKNMGTNSVKHQAKVIAFNGSSMNLTGNYQGQPILEIDGIEPIVFPSELSIKIKDGAVLLGGNAVMEVHGPLTVENVDFDATYSAYPYEEAIRTIGQPKVVIKNAHFEDGKVGIHCESYIGNNAPYIENISAENMKVAVESFGASLSINVADISNCTDGVNIYTPSKTSELFYNRIEECENGVKLYGQANGTLISTYGTYKLNASGITPLSGTVQIRCSNFDENGVALAPKYNSSFNMNENHKMGSNIFINNGLIVAPSFTLNPYGIDISNGNTKFDFDNVYGADHYTFSGYLSQVSTVGSPASGYSLVLPSSHNYWYPYNPIHNLHYDLKFKVNTVPFFSEFNIDLYHSNDFVSSSALYIKQTNLCPSWSSGVGTFTVKDKGDRAVDADNQSVTNSYYSNATLGAVFADINERAYYNHDFSGAFERGKSILAFNFLGLSEFDEYVLQNVYRTTMESYGEIFYDSNTLDIAGITTEFLPVLENLEQRAENASDTFWHEQEVQIAMDIAEVYRMNNKRDTSLLVLSDKLGSKIDISDAEVDNINMFMCAINAEKDVLAGIITISQKDSLYNCFVVDTIPPTSPPPAPEQITEKVVNGKPIIDWETQPNPAETGMEVVFKLKSKRYVEIEIFDVLGHKMVGVERAWYKKGVNSVSIDVSNWPTGVYMVHFKYDQYSDAKRLVINRN